MSNAAAAAAEVDGLSTPIAEDELHQTQLVGAPGATTKTTAATTPAASTTTTTATTTTTTTTATTPVTVIPLCKHWARSKNCLYHNLGKCRFSHPEDYVVPPPPPPSCRHHRGQQKQKQRQTDLRHRHRANSGRLTTRNDARVAILRAFVASPHPVVVQQRRDDNNDNDNNNNDNNNNKDDDENNGNNTGNENGNDTQAHAHTPTPTQTQTPTHTDDAQTTTTTVVRTVRLDLTRCNVLDVAGGKGELAFQLLNLNNAASCHVVDPRPLSLDRYRKRLRKGFYHRSQGILQHDVVRPRTEPERPVDQLRCLFSSELWESEQEEEREQERDERGKEEGANDDDKTTNTNSNDKAAKRNLRKEFFRNCYRAQGWVWPPVGSDNEHAAAFGDDDNDNDRDKPSNSKSNKKSRTKSKHTTTTTPTTADTEQQPSVGEDSNPANDNDELGVDTNDLSSSSSSATGDATTTPTTGFGFTPTFDHASNVVRTANLIVGMHPDQAVDAIVDAALAKNISFFVVPCCVYSKEFPNRRVAVLQKKDDDNDNDENNGNDENNDNDKNNETKEEDGAAEPTTNTNTNTSTNTTANTTTNTNTNTTAKTKTTKLVTTYDDLIRYLMAKSPDIRKHTLPFEGRNICLYRVVVE